MSLKTQARAMAKVSRYLNDTAQGHGRRSLPYSAVLAHPEASPLSLVRGEVAKANVVALFSKPKVSADA